MKIKPTLPTLALSVVLAAAVAMPVLTVISTPAVAAAKQPTLSPPVYKLVKEAGENLDKNQNQEALPKLQEALKIAKTPFETYIVNDYLGRAYLAVEDYPNAGAAFEAAYLSGALPPDAKESRLKITTQIFLQAQNFPKAIEFANHYATDIGPDAEMLALLGEAQYLSKDLKGASENLNKALSLAEAKKQPVKEEWFRYLEHAEAEQNNLAAVIVIEEKLVQNFPKKENWASLLTNFSSNIKGSDKVTLDLYRLMLAANVMKGSSDYMEMAKVALQQTLPGEAKAVLQKGFDGGVLSSGPMKAEATQLLNKATADAAADLKALSAGAKEAAAKPTGEGEVRFGEAFWTYGQYDQAIAAIQHGISKGGVKDPDDAQLRLGLAYLGAGKKTEALQTFNALTSSSPFARIAHLWALYATYPPA